MLNAFCEDTTPLGRLLFDSFLAKMAHQVCEDLSTVSQIQMLRKSSNAVEIFLFTKFSFISASSDKPSQVCELA